MRPVWLFSPPSVLPGGDGWKIREAAGWVAFSLVLHVLALLALLSLPQPERRSEGLVLMPLEEGSPEAGPIAYLTPLPPGERGRERRETSRTGLVARPSVVEEPAGREGQQAAVRDTVPRPPVAAIGTRRRLGPAYGTGRLWVPPVDILELGRPLPPAEGEAVAARPGVETLERLATERLMAFLDTMPPDSFAPPSAPAWTTEIAGKTWGIDAKWIYLGDIKLPAALLALLPLPQGGYNFDQARAAQELMRMRQDLLEAARRAETAAEFQRYVKELRKRKEEERQQRARVARDTIIP
ncbi:hypothetical protein HRbin33_00015 [bacterium HR33]|nr:hypothetical protein HRbin33_00015 [bacterium HR33]